MTASTNQNQELLEYEERYWNFYNKLSSIGLTNEDYEELIQILYKLKDKRYRAVGLQKKFIERHNLFYLNQEELMIYQNINQYLQKVDKLFGKYFELAELLRHSVVPRTLKAILNDECSLVHMVFTNNPTGEEVKMSSLDNYVFLCQYHQESYQTLAINSRINKGYCYNCNVSFHLIDYFMQKEGLTYQEAVNLLAKIYLIELKNQEFGDNNPLVQKYRHILLSSEYKTLVENGIIRVSSKEPTWMQKKALAKLKYDLETIKRIEQGNTIKFTGKKPDYQRLVLSKEEVCKRL